MTSPQAIQQCFKMPTSRSITGRTSSITNAFVAAITPVIPPTVAQIAQVLNLLETHATDLRCAYCGDLATEWEHLRPLVKNSRPTGFPSSIKNLVPSCGKCNQSKGNTDWEVWMRSQAARSPYRRNILDLEERIERRKRYERWADCQPIDLASILGDQDDTRYWQLLTNILAQMQEAQILANELSRKITSYYQDKRS